MKKLLIVSILLTGSVNADIFKALKDAAAKAVEVQNGLKNQSEESMASSDQSSPPQFNSLAEEAAYKKKQKMLAEQQNIAEEKQYEEKEKNRKERFKVKQNAILEKYLIKKADSPDMIDNKFKNRVILFSSITKDYKELEQLTEFGESRVSVIDVPDTYISFNLFNIAECQDQECKVEAFKQYEQYIKFAYETYESRKEEAERKLQEVKEYNANAEKAQKNQQAKAINEQKERQKVQSACQAWRSKANKGVYSLGIGDQVMSSGGAVYVIQGVNTNTFLVNSRFGAMYLQKSDLIPYSLAKTAPSEYCYR